MNKPVN